ncbi:MAG: tRNA (N(6)-L-threonylcarbamoyladenosine(37)-C(2))-methylthiotransferase MtaB [Clostridia bacterium]|nr:tRNA (N(6)-L-threonylcarbamoyladenosine(37)-C(2))-methylthiotransferase MtaB [Clostridia bacterium]MDD4275704.1 tRNA (N(6)-L-threonylcarbamoyladenosine(37)-C(2))-methylthiotransferase MtaB [Clostridia bacterium]
MNISIYTLGCKVNQYESDSLATVLKKRGHKIVADYSLADAFIINTCAVTSEAEKKSRQTITKLSKYSPNAKIIVCGCASQNNPNQFIERDNVTVVMGTANRNNIANLIDSVSYKLNTLPIDYENISNPMPTRTRTYIKIQDGCNSYCTYCIIPHLRGCSRSRDIKSIFDECSNLPKNVKEIVLTGINISDYGSNINTNLIELVKALSNLKIRIRLGSLEQNIITEEFLDALKTLPYFCEHFHLSMQSGSDTILKKMNRKYTSITYLEKVELIRKHFPNATIATDVIVGFPTETDQEFEETLEVVSKAKFTTIHIFPYSLRTGTPAEKFKQVSFAIKSQREARLKVIAKDLEREFLQQNIGKTESVLIETVENGEAKGYTKNYIMTYILGNNLKEDTVVNVRLNDFYKNGLKAELI